jgi:hypothetical protein
MKGWLSLLVALAALACGGSLIDTPLAALPCGPLVERRQAAGAGWARDDSGRPLATADGVRARQRLVAAPCEP